VGLRAVRRGVLVAAVALVAVVVAGGPAAAHATLLVTTPLADSAVAEPPPYVELVFNERVVVHEVAVRDAAGKRYPLGAAATGGGGRAVTVPVEADLPAGVYTVRWEVTGTDGDRHGDEFRFAVGAAVVEPGTSIGGPASADHGTGLLVHRAVLDWHLRLRHPLVHLLHTRVVAQHLVVHAFHVVIGHHLVVPWYGLRVCALVRPRRTGYQRRSRGDPRHDRRHHHWPTRPHHTPHSGGR
jgi:methionine-rich copper-binding protein CopC